MKTIPNKLTTPPEVQLAPGVRGGFPYRQPETNVPFAYNTWNELIGNVAKHRQGMTLDLADGWLRRFEHDVCEQFPHLACVDDSVPPTFETPLAIAGRALWLELHAFTEQYPETPAEDDKSRARYWMSAWRERIPRFGGCACREDWARLEANYPPDYSSREAFVRWGQISHDAVSRKIGKPLFNAEQFQAAVAAGFNVFP